MNAITQKGFFTSEFWGAIGATLIIALFTYEGADSKTIADAQQQWLVIVNAMVECIKVVAEAAIWIWYAYQRTRLKSSIS